MGYGLNYVYIMTQQILLPSVRVTYNYTTNQLTAMMGSVTRSAICHSIDIEHEALTLASSVAGRPVYTIVCNHDNFLFR
jgi:hypothetical protein